MNGSFGNVTARISPPWLNPASRALCTRPNCEKAQHLTFPQIPGRLGNLPRRRFFRRGEGTPLGHPESLHPQDTQPAVFPARFLHIHSIYVHYNNHLMYLLYFLFDILFEHLYIIALGWHHSTPPGPKNKFDPVHTVSGRKAGAYCRSVRATNPVTRSLRRD
jgi:hypothetical protein